MSDNAMLFLEWGSAGPVEFNLHESGNVQTGKLLFRGKFQEAEAINKNKRRYPYKILDENVERLKDTMADGGLTGECDHPCLVDPNFEVLTLDGWKSFNEIRQGDEVFSRVNGKMVRSIVKEIINSPYNGRAIRVKGSQIDCTFTGPHKMLMCKKNGEEYYETIEQIHLNRSEHSNSYIPKTASWDRGVAKKIFLKGIKKNNANSIEIDAANFVEFLGIYLDKGNLTTNNWLAVSIKHTLHCGKEELKKILDNLHPEIKWEEGETGFYTKDERLYNYLIPLGNKLNRYIPKEIKDLPSFCLEKLIINFLGLYFNNKETSLKSKTFANYPVLSKSKSLIDDLHECIVKCGVSATNKGRVVLENSLNNKYPLYRLVIANNKGIDANIKYLTTIETHHQGSIYCLTTEHGNFYMKYKGNCFWTGNCDSIVHLKDVSHKITKLWWEGNVLMGEGEVLTTPAGMILRRLIADGVRIGMSSRGVGNGQINEDGILVIGESYKLITFDAVQDPSTHQAYQREVKGAKRENYAPKILNIPSEINKSSIDTTKTTFNKEQVLACLGGIFKSQTNEFKARFK